MGLVFGRVEGLGQLNRVLDRYVKEVGADSFNESRIAGRNLAVSLARLTAPRGDQASDEIPGKNKVAADIRRVYITAGGVYKKLRPIDETRARIMWAAYQAGSSGYGSVRKILARTKFAHLPVAFAIDKELHQSVRRNGEVNKNQGPRQLALSVQRRRSYINKRQKKVGLAKSGWTYAAKELGGTKGIPDWAGLRRHRRKLGGALKKPKGLSPGVVIENHARHIRPSIKKALLTRAIKDTTYRLEERLNKALEAKNRRRRR